MKEKEREIKSPTTFWMEENMFSLLGESTVDKGKPPARMFQNNFLIVWRGVMFVYIYRPVLYLVTFVLGAESEEDLARRLKRYV